MPGRLVRKATYEVEYHHLTQTDGVPFVPSAVWKDLFFVGGRPGGGRCVRGVFRSLRSHRAARSDHYSNRSQARLLFPVALRVARAAASFDGDAGASDRPCHRDWRRCLLLPFLVRRRRKELAPAADCRAHRSADRGRSAVLYPSRRIQALESGNERVERGADPGEIPAGQNCARTPGSAGVPGQAMPQLPRARRKEAASAVPRSTPSRRGSPRTSSSARYYKAAATCPHTETA